MNGHVLIMMDTDLPISKSHIRPNLPSEMDGEDEPGPGIVNLGKCRVVSQFEFRLRVGNGLLASPHPNMECNVR